MRDEEIKQILTTYQRIAVVGMSRDLTKPARKVPKFLMSKKYHIIPVNPFTDEILGMKSYPSVSQIPESVEIVEIFRPSEAVPAIVEDVLRRVKEKGDVKVIWMQEGIEHPESAERAKQAGLKVVQNRCMYKEYVRLIEERVPDLL